MLRPFPFSSSSQSRQRGSARDFARKIRSGVLWTVSPRLPFSPSAPFRLELFTGSITSLAHPTKPPYPIRCKAGSTKPFRGIARGSCPTRFEPYNSRDLISSTYLDYERAQMTPEL